MVGDLGAFWKSVSEGPALRRVTHGPRLHAVLARVAGAPVRAHDYLFLRAAPVGRTTGLHFDYPFFTRATERVYTGWVPLGDVPATDGPLVIVEGSHRFTDLHDEVRGFDVVYDTSRKAQVASDFAEFAESRDCRLLTADFRAGDVCIFGMLTLHGSLDNHSPLGRVRLSCDVRYQPAAEPIDPRYFGPNPGGTTGAGRAAKPASRHSPEREREREPAMRVMIPAARSCASPPTVIEATVTRADPGRTVRWRRALSRARRTASWSP